VNKYEKYIDLVLKWNKTHSVTNYNKNELKEQVKQTIKPIEYLNQDIKTAIDIGTGAGIPGLILAIAMPTTSWYLIEPLQKRYSFLNYAKLSLQLDNIKVIPKRIEQIKPFNVDLITSRAVKNTEFLIKLSCAFIDNNTNMLLYKGPKAKEEIKNINANKKIIENKLNYVILKDIKC
jgi:16S rRNA (guanine527-N7)-methyltransferase